MKPFFNIINVFPGQEPDRFLLPTKVAWINFLEIGLACKLPVVTRIPTVKLKIPGKAFFKSESRTSVTLKFLTLGIYQWQRLGLPPRFSWPWEPCGQVLE